MTTTDFTEKFPKPWCYVMHKCTFTLTAANGNIVGQLHLGNFHSGIPQAEWNRHVAAALGMNAIPVVPSE